MRKEGRQSSEVSGAQHEGPCTYRSPEKPGVLRTQDCLSGGKDVNLLFPSWGLEVIDSSVTSAGL